MGIILKMKLMIVLVVGMVISCNNPNMEVETFAKVAINLQHFNHLYKEIEIKGDTMGIVHIYSEYPDYTYEIEPAEGYTCVDDVSRAIIMLSEYHNTGIDTTETLRKIKMMIKFILHMQNENGYFNNFIWHDLTINTTYKTTVAELNWWSLRAFWALETVYPLVSQDAVLAEKIETSISKLMVNIQNDLGAQELIFDTINTLEIPSWLPNKYAADQAAVLILCLLPYQSRTGDDEAKALIDKMAQGIMYMQRGNASQYPYGAFMSWGNLWHAWGNSQAYALLRAGQQLDNEVYIASALKEVDNFYSYMLENGLAEAFWIEKDQKGFAETKRNAFPRIAYGIRPMVWAATEARQITNKQQYSDLAKELESWFHGNNAAKINMYDATNGRCYDGIIPGETVNKNSGAESTIECLLTLLKTN